MNPAAKCEPEFELMLLRALFKIFLNKIEVRNKSIFNKRSKKLILSGDFKTFEQEEQTYITESF